MRHERRPDDRYRATLRVGEEPAQPFEAALWRWKRHQEPNDVIIRVADAYEDEFERELLQAWIFAGASDQNMCDRLGIPLDVLAPYRHLCCNVLAFRDKLEMMRWVRRYEGSHQGKLMLDRAIHLDGVEAVAHLCGLPTALDPQRVHEQTMRETYFRGVATLRNSNISSADASAAHLMLKTAAVEADAAQRRGAPNLGETLLKLKHRDYTVNFGAENAMPPGEILH